MNNGLKQTSASGAPLTPSLLNSDRVGAGAAHHTSVQGGRKLRWFIVGWITLSTVLNLIDKNTLAILGPTIKQEFGLSNQDFSYILNAFLLSYAIMYTGAGRLVDWIGEKAGMLACVLWWSIANVLTAFVRSGSGLGVCRFLLGIGEPGNYPAALRATTRLFAKGERGLPIAIWSSGSSIGNLVAPPLIASLALRFGWRIAFFLPGILGLVWSLVWFVSYRVPSEAPPSQDAAYQEPLPSKPESLLALLKEARVRAIVLARFVSDPVWVFYLSWIPTYLSEQWGYNLKDIGLYAWVPFLFGAMGGVSGGALSDCLIRRGLQPVAARKRLLYAAGLVAPIGMAIGFASSSAVSLALLAVMSFVVYVWFINTAALITDAFPERVVASILGLMGTAGTLGGIGLNTLAGYVLDHYHSYTPMFLIAGSGHLLAALILLRFLNDEGPGDSPKGIGACS